MYASLSIMDTDEETELMLLAAILLKKKKRKKRKVWVQNIYKKREIFGIDRLVKEMRVNSRESYFK